MENRSLSVAGGVGGAALLAFFLGPWSSQAGNTVSTPEPKPVPVATTVQTPVQYSLSQNEQGPWSALCKVFASSDPEDSQSDPKHHANPQAGVEMHPPPLDKELLHRELKEETLTLPGGIQQKFIPRRHYKADLTSCLPSRKALNQFPLNFMIATLPDPLESHMGLEFDREIVAIERAASDLNFNFERYWFPWSEIIKAERPGGTDSPDDMSKKQLHDQPGILIFRGTIDQDKNSQDGVPPRLIVFVVGETATSGINKVAFSKAAAYISQLAPYTIQEPQPAQLISKCKTPRLEILGPTFSGSYSSLHTALATVYPDPCVQAEKALALSPGTSVSKIIKQFKTSSENLVELRTLSPTDAMTEDSIIKFLENKLSYNDSEIAYLSEDETPFHSYGKSDNKLTYPRDLSALRNAWQPSSMSLTPADLTGGAIKWSAVPFSLRETGSSESDSPSAFAPDQAAPDTDQALLNLVTTIRHRRYKAIIVTASNPLDLLYLLQYIRHNVPDVRLVTYSQDSMMLRATNYERLRGTISITSFPLTESLEVLGTKTTQFPDSNTEEEYIGARLLLNACARKFPLGNLLRNQDKCVDVNNAFDPKEKEEFPGAIEYVKNNLGIYALGNDTFWPINTDSLTILDGVTKVISKVKSYVPRTWYIFVISICVLSAAHFYSCRRLYCPHGISRGWENVRGSSRKEDLFEDCCLLICNNQLVVLSSVILLPSAMVWKQFLFPLDYPWYATTIRFCLAIALVLEVFITIVFSSLLVLRITRTFRETRRSGIFLKPRRSTYFLMGVALAYPIVAIVFWCVLELLDQTVDDMAFRTMYVLDGLSPLPVVLALSMIWYLFGRIELKIARTAKLMRVDPVLLDSCEAPPQWVTDLRTARKRVFRELESISASSYRDILIVISGYLVLIVLQTWTALRAVDEWPFRIWLFFAGFGLVGVTIVAEFIRVWSVWKKTQSLLIVLEGSPLAAVFMGLPDDVATVKVWRSPENMQPRALQECTVHRLRILRDSAPESIQKTLDSYLESADFLVEEHSHRTALNECHSFKDHSLLNACFDFSLTVFPEGREWFLSECEQDSSAALEFLALRYIAMIRYVNAQMRHVLLFVLFGYVLLIVGLKTYPFEGQQALASVLTVIFTIIFVLAAVMVLQMDRNPLLSNLERTTPGKADLWQAAQRLLSIGGIPLVAILASQFPSIERFFFSWIQPTIDSLH